MRSISYGNVIILNPSDDEIKRHQKYEEDLLIESKLLDNKVFIIILLCEELEESLSIEQLLEYADKIEKKSRKTC
jgi:hypothetical protein